MENRCSTLITHWGRVTHVCVSKLTMIGSDNGLSPGRRQAIIWSNPGILLIQSLGTILSEILNKIHTISFINTYELFNLGALKISPVDKMYIFQCMGKIFGVEFQRYPYLTHTLKHQNFKISTFKSSSGFLKCHHPPEPILLWCQLDN